MTGLNWNRRTSAIRTTSTWTGLSLCATIATSLIAILSGFFSSSSSYSSSIIQNVDCVPVKLVADFPTFAATLLGSLGQQQNQQEQQQSLVTSSSSSSYLTNDRESDDDSLDEQPPAHQTTSASTFSTTTTTTTTTTTKTDSPPPSSRYSSPSKAQGILADYELDLLDRIQSNANISGISSSQITTLEDVEDGGAPVVVTTSGTALLQTPMADGGDIVATQSINNSASHNASDSQSGHNNSGSSSGSSGNSITTTLTLLSGGKKSHIIRLPNGQSFQFCDELDLNCRDENAVCKMGACVCKPGFFLHRQSGECQSISDLLKNCENDYQCQAFDVDLVCDTKSHERSFCDCAEGLYFDQDTYSCIPCHRNTFVLATNNKELLKKLNQPHETDSSPILNATTTGSPESNVTNSSNSSSTPETTLAPPQSKGTPTLRPCKPIDLAKLNYRRRKQQQHQQQQQQQQQVPYSSLYDQPTRGSGSSLSTASTSSTSSTSYHPGSSSDPFRIRTPLEVFMGAIMLFTVLTVAWFFIQRMFHDCRVILRSLRNPDFTGHCNADGSGQTGGLGGGAGGLGLGGGIPSHLTGILPNSRPGSQLYLDPAGQAVARLLSNEHGYNSSLAGIYQRDLAGVMVQHLAANLSPSSTNHALAAAANGSFSRGGDNEISLYPLAISSQQSRNAAAAAAAQLLLSPSHPAIAILRAAAASANQNQHPDYNQTSLLNSMLDSPPKYEEAIAQSGPINQPSSYVPHHQLHDNRTIISSRTCDDNDENTQADDLANELAADRNTSGQQYNNSQNSNPPVDGDDDDGGDTTNIDQTSERNDDLGLNNNNNNTNTASSDNSQPPDYQSIDTHSVNRGESSTNSSGGPSETEQTNSRRQNSTKRKVTRRSRRGRDSINRNGQQQQQSQQQPQQQQQQQQDSDDTLTESH